MVSVPGASLALQHKCGGGRPSCGARHTRTAGRRPLASVRRVTSRGIYVETRIAVPVERVWSLTQDPVEHVRWDVRFSQIVPTTPTDNGATRFTYTRRTL